VEDNSQQIIGVNAVLGACKDQSAYQSKLAGISGIILVLDMLCKKLKIDDGSIQIGLSGQQALNIVQPDYDLLKAI
jgi:hypothetical protein